MDKFHLIQIGKSRSTLMSTPSSSSISSSSSFSSFPSSSSLSGLQLQEDKREGAGGMEDSIYSRLQSLSSTHFNPPSPSPFSSSSFSSSPFSSISLRMDSKETSCGSHPSHLRISSTLSNLEQTPSSSYPMTPAKSFPSFLPDLGDFYRSKDISKRQQEEEKKGILRMKNEAKKLSCQTREESDPSKRRRRCQDLLSSLQEKEEEQKEEKEKENVSSYPSFSSPVFGDGKCSIDLIHERRRRRDSCLSNSLPSSSSSPSSSSISVFSFCQREERVKEKRALEEEKERRREEERIQQQQQKRVGYGVDFLASSFLSSNFNEKRIEASQNVVCVKTQQKDLSPSHRQGELSETSSSSSFTSSFHPFPLSSSPPPSSSSQRLCSFSFTSSSSSSCSSSSHLPLSFSSSSSASHVSRRELEKTERLFESELVTFPSSSQDRRRPPFHPLPSSSFHVHESDCLPKKEAIKKEKEEREEKEERSFLEERRKEEISSVHEKISHGYGIDTREKDQASCGYPDEVYVHPRRQVSSSHKKNEKMENEESLQRSRKEEASPPSAMNGERRREEERERERERTRERRENDKFHQDVFAYHEDGEKKSSSCSVLPKGVETDKKEGFSFSSRSPSHSFMISLPSSCRLQDEGEEERQPEIWREGAEEEEGGGVKERNRQKEREDEARKREGEGRKPVKRISRVEETLLELQRRNELLQEELDHVMSHHIYLQGQTRIENERGGRRRSGDQLKQGGSDMNEVYKEEKGGGEEEEGEKAGILSEIGFNGENRLRDVTVDGGLESVDTSDGREKRNAEGISSPPSFLRGRLLPFSPSIRPEERLRGEGEEEKKNRESFEEREMKTKEKGEKSLLEKENCWRMFRERRNEICTFEETGKETTKEKKDREKDRERHEERIEGVKEEEIPFLSAIDKTERKEEEERLEILMKKEEREREEEKTQREMEEEEEKKKKMENVETAEVGNKKEKKYVKEEGENKGGKKKKNEEIDVKEEEKNKEEEREEKNKEEEREEKNKEEEREEKNKEEREEKNKEEEREEKTKKKREKATKGEQYEMRNAMRKKKGTKQRGGGGGGEEEDEEEEEEKKKERIRTTTESDLLHSHQPTASLLRETKEEEEAKFLPSLLHPIAKSPTEGSGLPYTPLYPHEKMKKKKTSTDIPNGAEDSRRHEDTVMSTSHPQMSPSLCCSIDQASHDPAGQLAPRDKPSSLFSLESSYGEKEHQETREKEEMDRDTCPLHREVRMAKRSKDFMNTREKQENSHVSVSDQNSDACDNLLSGNKKDGLRRSIEQRGEEEILDRQSTRRKDLRADQIMKAESNERGLQENESEKNRSGSIVSREREEGEEEEEEEGDGGGGGEEEKKMKERFLRDKERKIEDLVTERGERETEEKDVKEKTLSFLRKNSSLECGENETRFQEETQGSISFCPYQLSSSSEVYVQPRQDKEEMKRKGEEKAFSHSYLCEGETSKDTPCEVYIHPREENVNRRNEVDELSSILDLNFRNEGAQSLHRENTSSIILTTFSFIYCQRNIEEKTGPFLPKKEKRTRDALASADFVKYRKEIRELSLGKKLKRMMDIFSLSLYRLSFHRLRSSSFFSHRQVACTFPPPGVYTPETNMVTDSNRMGESLLSHVSLTTLSGVHAPDCKNLEWDLQQIGKDSSDSPSRLVSPSLHLNSLSSEPMEKKREEACSEEKPFGEDLFDRLIPSTLGDVLLGESKETVKCVSTLQEEKKRKKISCQRKEIFYQSLLRLVRQKALIYEHLLYIPPKKEDEEEAKERDEGEEEEEEERKEKEEKERDSNNVEKSGKMCKKMRKRSPCWEKRERLHTELLQKILERKEEAYQDLKKRYKELYERKHEKEDERGKEENEKFAFLQSDKEESRRFDVKMQEEEEERKKYERTNEDPDTVEDAEEGEGLNEEEKGKRLAQREEEEEETALCRISAPSPLESEDLDKTASIQDIYTQHEKEREKEEEEEEKEKEEEEKADQLGEEENEEKKNEGIPLHEIDKAILFNDMKREKNGYFFSSSAFLFSFFSTGSFPIDLPLPILEPESSSFSPSFSFSPSSSTVSCSSYASSSFSFLYSSSSWSTRYHTLLLLYLGECERSREISRKCSVYIHQNRRLLKKLSTAAKILQEVNDFREQIEKEKKLRDKQN